MSIQRPGQYGLQVATAVQQMDKLNRFEADIRITPENTIIQQEDSIQLSAEAIENIMAYTKKDMELVDGKAPRTKADGMITLKELQHFFRDGLDDPEVNAFAEERAQGFMKAFDRGNGKGGAPDQKLTLDELTARNVVEVVPREAFKPVITTEIENSPLPEGIKLADGYSLSVTETGLNQRKIDETPETAGVSTLKKRIFLENQFIMNPNNTGQAADYVLKEYNLNTTARNVFNMQ